MTTKTRQAKKSTGAKSAKPKTANAKMQAKATAKNKKRMSQIEAAVAVLAKARKPMTCKAMVEVMANQGLWTTPGGATPDATLYTSILRDLKKGKDARFKKVARGQFALATRKAGGRT